jgi:putative protease
MFHTEWCVFAGMLSTVKDWRDCGRPCDQHKIDLRDRAGAAFPVMADMGCRNTVYNAVPRSAAEFLPRMLALGLRWFRVELLRETPAEVGPLLERYAAVLSGKNDGRGVAAVAGAEPTGRHAGDAEPAVADTRWCRPGRSPGGSIGQDTSRARFRAGDQ